MRLYRDRAVVLRQHKLGEADRIVTLLTRDHGLVRAVAKGVRRTRSKFGARLEPFAHIDVQLHPGRNLDIVTLVQAVDAFPPTSFNANLPVTWTPTVELTAHVRRHACDGWLACAFSTRNIAGGYLETDGEIWDEAGSLVAQSRQLQLVPSQ